MQSWNRLATRLPFSREPIVNRIITSKCKNSSLRAAAATTSRIFSSTQSNRKMSAFTGKGLSDADHGDLKEYSVVYTDRAINLMSSPFQTVMRDISASLKSVYKADACAIIPGSGTYAMEAAARQFGTGEKCLVIRNGFFSFRWSEIFEVCSIPSEEIVLKGRTRDAESESEPQFAPCPVEEVVEKILSEKPKVVFAPHVETSTGILLSNEYIKKVTEAVHKVGGIFVLDAIASGTLWVDMKELDVDALISAPQKGWSGPACCGIVMMRSRAVELCETKKATSFSCNLTKWLTVMQKYEEGGFMYYTTLPTDALTVFRNTIKETEAYGLEKAEAAMRELGAKVRAALEERGYKSVAYDEVKSPSVVVSYAPRGDMVAQFKGSKIQIAGGVPFKLDEPSGLQTFRIGLFGLDKINDIDGTVAKFVAGLDNIKN